MNKLRFDIECWQALSPGLVCDSDWTTWAANGKAWPETLTPAPVSDIPAMLRRRMSALSKLAIQTAMMLVKDQSVDFIVFSSRHGELPRTAKLLQDVLQGDDASPIAFSQSVHNTAAGLFTIATKKAIPVTSIAAGEHSLHSALIDAVAYLDEHPQHRVLVVDFDEPLPMPYEGFEEAHHHAFALGMILTSGDRFALRWSKRKVNTEEKAPGREVQPLQTLEVIGHLAMQETSWSVNGLRSVWYWNE